MCVRCVRVFSLVCLSYFLAAIRGKAAQPGPSFLAASHSPASEPSDQPNRRGPMRLGRILFGTSRGFTIIFFDPKRSGRVETQRAFRKPDSKHAPNSHRSQRHNFVKLSPCVDDENDVATSRKVQRYGKAFVQTYSVRRRASFS